jgi:hypothetical protein
VGGEGVSVDTGAAREADKVKRRGRVASILGLVLLDCCLIDCWGSGLASTHGLVVVTRFMRRLCALYDFMVVKVSRGGSLRAGDGGPGCWAPVLGQTVPVSLLCNVACVCAL